MTLPTSLLAAALSLAAPLPPADGAVPVAPDPVTVTSVPAPGTPADGLAASAFRQGAESMAVLAPSMVTAPLLKAGNVEEAILLQARDRRGVPLMASGAALLVAGLLIGGDVGTLVALGGAVIGAYGVFLYF